ncbi:YjbH domain-containing protein [Aestuariibius sp. 2305UL40-4]|uniref:YjbH domain-containing protein n=1 Tax=Aestuariibius violaceus TaxID=3234132 RepID=UPI00345EC285
MKTSLPCATTSALAITISLIAAGASAQGHTYNLYGEPGLIEMPTADTVPEGEVALTFGSAVNQFRNTFTFQATPRLSGSFRYARIDEFGGPGEDETFDRSFDLRFRFIDEGVYRPAVAVGLRDFLGTGRFSAEYLVATKRIGERLSVTGGLGWGRLGSRDGFENPLGVLDEGFETRPELEIEEGGEVNTDQLFRGDAAIFGGLSYQVTDTLTFLAEYSSDAYTFEEETEVFEASSPVNVGLSWRPRPGFEFGLHYLYGEELAASASIVINAKERPTVGGFDIAPLPVLVRTQNVLAAESWDDPSTAAGFEAIEGSLAQAIEGEGLVLVDLDIRGSVARVRYENPRYRSEPQAMGRIARLLTHAMPPNVETFVLTPQRTGLPASAVTIRRTDMERLENQPGGTELSFDRAIIADAPAEVGLSPEPADVQRFRYNLAPYFRISSFDSSEPVRGEIGAELSASYDIRPNLILQGALRQRITGNLEEGDPIQPTGLEPVRTNIGFYNEADGVTIPDLTLAYYFKPGDQLYGRVTGGYLERMFGGISTELLWSPANSPWAFGAEVNAVQQRDFDQRFGFQDYDVVTGHVSAYYDFDNGFYGRVDVGRYLAGDSGATFALDREFDNGFRVGGFFTLTDASEEDFGEGSFDKGVSVSIPTDWFFGTPSRRRISTSLNSLTRDGGQRVSVPGRLYGTVSGAQNPDLEEGWGRFWR